MGLLIFNKSVKSSCLLEGFLDIEMWWFLAWCVIHMPCPGRQWNLLSGLGLKLLGHWLLETTFPGPLLGRRKEVNALETELERGHDLVAMSTSPAVRWTWVWIWAQLITCLESVVSPRHSQMVSELVLVCGTFYTDLWPNEKN